MTDYTLPHTIKQKKLLKAIPKANTLKEAGAMAGYSFESRNIYRASTKKHIEKSLQAMGYSEEAIKEEFERLSKLSELNKDFSNAMRGKENIARMCGYFKDKQEITTKNEVPPALDKETLRNRLKDAMTILDDKPDEKSSG